MLNVFLRAICFICGINFFMCPAAPAAEFEITDKLSVGGAAAFQSSVTVNGNVGIGTASPSYKLDVNGDVNVSGNLNASGNFTAAGSMTIPAGTTAQRPGTPATGMLRLNSDTAKLEYYDGTGWMADDHKVYATGGTITTSGGYRIHTFTSSGILTVVYGGNVEYLVVAGGGAGGTTNAGNAGGGGAGGFRTGTLNITAQAYPIAVGDGGLYSVQGNGGNSVFSTITSVGGGYGGSYNKGWGNNGGSGGGAGQGDSTTMGGTGTAGQGNKGGDGQGGENRGAGGGGGAGAAGGNPYGSLYKEGGAGGNGTTSSISGSPVTYAGGGGGSTHGSGSGVAPGGDRRGWKWAV